MSDVFSDWLKVLRLATKPTREEYMLTLKIVVLGLGLLGGIGFVFQLVGSMLEFASIGSVSREYALVGGILVGVVIVFVAVYLRNRSKL